MPDNANTSNVVPASDHAQISRVKFDVIRDFPRCDINYDGVVDLIEVMF